MDWNLIFDVLGSFLVALYLGFRSINLFNIHHEGYINTLAKKLYWLFIFIGAFSFLGCLHFSNLSDYWLPLIGYLLFSIIICFFWGIVIIDIIRFIRRFIFQRADNKNIVIQGLFIGISFSLFLIGLYCSSQPRVVTYDINVDKPANVESLKIVQISDIHLNEITSKKFIQDMVSHINDLNPDYVFFTGDTLDGKVKPFIDKKLAEDFRQIHSTYGTFIIFGNHEHYGIERDHYNTTQDVINAFKDGNMKVLLDDVYYDEQTGISIIGRDDLSEHRMDLPFLMNFVDEDKPIILLDHQPADLIEPENLGIDVMFAGHTHGGQIFPMTLVVNEVYQNPWGIYQPKDNKRFTSIVTCGYGLWGPPIRLMTRAEIVVAELHFKKQIENKD
ncbi:metallophosphoesterase [Frischella sp. Ac13]|uniref:Metallophosphoesterase n=1 Tax=Frischella japonica TaxID=2741544 RepID=A0ABR7QXL8_9GAMM|nr:metallophosphoesterase [Frischella japonica]MBC9130830.1 metallophosphoesterase [Frischella japonica]